MILVKLGRAIELDTSTWTWTWNKKDNFVVASNLSGNSLYIFAEPKKKGSLAGKRLSKGSKLFRRFHGFAPDGTRSGSAKNADRSAGRGLHVIYHSDKFGAEARYIHEFVSLPYVYVDNLRKPSILELRRGKIAISARGIEG